MKPLTATVVLLSILAAPVRAGDDRPARWVRDPLLRKRIDKAIAAGIDYLRGIQMSDGRWTYHNRPVPNTPGRLNRPGRAPTPRTPRAPSPGRRTNPTSTTKERDAGLTALALYALAASGVPRNDPSIVKGLAWIGHHPRAYDTASSLGTYSTSLLILALTRIDPVEHGSAIRTLADRLVKAQSGGGLWSYGLRPPREHKFPRVDGRGRNVGDNSNTQFAALALWAAHSLAGHNAPRATWIRLERLYRRSQVHDGSWPYRLPTATPGLASPRQSGTSTMTAAGLVSYIYAAAALDGRETALHRARSSPQIKGGYRAFSRFLKKTDWTNFYLVYSIERVGTVVGLRDLSWYETGCEKLCDAQQDGGRFKDPGRYGDGRHAYATSLALLFLGRGTLPPRKGAVTPPDRIDVLTPKERRPMMQTAKSHRRAFEIYLTLPRRDRRDDAATFGARGKEFVDVLVIVLSTDGRAEAREAAHEIIEVLLGRRFLYDARAYDRDLAIMTRMIVDTWARMRAKAVWDSRARHWVAR